jgi:poly(A) polymerase
VRGLEERLGADPAVGAVRAALGVERAGAPSAWIVGGTVRDAALGRPLSDVDLVVAGDPEQAARAVARRARGPAFPLSEEFGAWRAVARREGWVCDVAALRGTSIEDDLAARDFTVNAVAVPLAGGARIDPHHGVDDLERRRLRVLGGPTVEDSAYGADPVRPLRLARLATELPLVPDPYTERLTREAAPRVVSAAAERVFGELRRIVVAERALEGVELADRLGLLDAVLPELEALRGVEQSAFHHLDVHAHTLEVIRRQVELEGRLDELFGPEVGARLRAELAEPLGDELTRGQALRFGALLHDVGKPATRGVRPDGRVTFLGHDRVGAEMVDAVCRRLRTSERLRAFLAALAAHHLVLGFLVHERPLSRRAIYRYLRACEPVEVEVTLLSCADRLATRGRGHERAIAAHLELARELMAEALAWREAGGAPRPPVRGDELAAALELEPGPALGRLLEALSEARFAGEAPDRARALDLARRLRDNPRS